MSFFEETLSKAEVSLVFMEIQTRILEHATQLFLKYGVKSITMDDIAKELGISKKTIYQSFSSKADIVYQTAKSFFLKEIAQAEVICNEASNAVDELLRTLQWTINTLTHISPSLIMEVEKYYPQTWEVFTHFQQDYLLRLAQENLERGISEGYFRDDLNIDIVARIRILQIQASLSTQIFPLDQFDPISVQREILEVYAYSILTQKGKEVYHQYLTAIQASK